MIRAVIKELTAYLFNVRATNLVKCSKEIRWTDLCDERLSAGIEGRGLSWEAKRLLAKKSWLCDTEVLWYNRPHNLQHIDK